MINKSEENVLLRIVEFFEKIKTSPIPIPNSAWDTLFSLIFCKSKNTENLQNTLIEIGSLSLSCESECSYNFSDNKIGYKCSDCSLIDNSVFCEKFIISVTIIITILIN
jgi:hypothetical protein